MNSTSEKNAVVSVILAGGSGTRLWPLSRESFPKQFYALHENETLFQQACQRSDVFNNSSLLVIANEDQRFIAKEQLREVSCQNANIILEPQGKNTAASATLGSLYALEHFEDPILFIMPSDQRILDESSFKKAANKAIEMAKQDHIVIMGIKPTKPSSAFGYFQEKEGNVVVFKEKPDLKTAEYYVESGNYFWNAGIFIVKASIWIKALIEFYPELFNHCQRAWNSKRADESFIRLDHEKFEDIPSESIDIAVIEKIPESTFSIKMVQLNAGWSDLGAWDSVWETSQRDKSGNFFDGDIISANASNTYAYSFSSSRLIALLGTNDLLVIDSPDALLISDKKNAQEVGKIVSDLKGINRTEAFLHRKVFRPWGWYDSIDQDHLFQVKRIHVYPGASLSLQRHSKRSEHWIVVKGSGEVTCDERVFKIKENESIFIPLGAVHRLSNPEKDSLEIIEVQYGHYLGEDDIERLDDIYGRAE